jgi:hypothetical protein
MRYPVTFLQQSRLLYEESMWNIGHPIIPFNVGSALLLEGSLDVAALERSLNLIVDRHAGLHAAIMQAGGLSSSEREIMIGNLLGVPDIGLDLYSQCLVDCAPLQLPVHFIESLDLEGQEVEIENIMTRSLATPYDYTRPPFVRAHLFRLSNDRHLLIVSIHHFVCDMSGLQLFIGEIEIFYNSIVSQTSPRLPVIKRNFLDFALEQNLRAKNNSYDDSICYWNNQLVSFWPAQPNLDDLKPLNIKSGYPTDFETDTEALFLDISDLKLWRSYAKKKHISLNMLFTAACMILIKKYARKDDAIAVWSNFANRTNPDYQNAIGSYVNTLILGIKLSDRLTINEVLLNVRTCVLNAIKHQSAPLPLVLSKFNPASPTGNGIQIVCDTIPLCRSEICQYKTNPITIKPIPMPEFMMGDISSALLIRLCHYSTFGMLTASFPKDKISEDPVLKMLEEIKNIIIWCMDNDNEIIANYKMMHDSQSPGKSSS